MISYLRSPLDERQCILCMFRPQGQQPRLAFNFRGGGKRITDDKKLAYHPDVGKYFQKMSGYLLAFV